MTDMFERVLPLLHQYILLGTTIANANAYYRGQLISVNEKSFEMRLYSAEGEYQGRLIAPTMAISSVQADTRELRELSLRVKFNMTCELEAMVASSCV
ncbi:MAG: hypothetical protein IPK79_04425 [Vampirovibrionales bacterium]|nr:hypothetical protein [Vampirovibrionales bacterium]